MKIISIDKNNIDQEYIFCYIGNDKQIQSRAGLKREWMIERFNVC